MVWHAPAVSREERESAQGHRGLVAWFTGLSGSGKSTVANEVERRLFADGLSCYRLDGDNLRHGLCADLGFSAEARAENLRRAAEVARLLVDAGLIVLASFIAPMRTTRAAIRERFADGRFLEIHVSTPLEVCEARDPKGLYRRARAGELRDFTGVDAPYEAPLNAEVVLPTHELGIDASAQRVVSVLRARSK